MENQRSSKKNAAQNHRTFDASDGGESDFAGVG